MAAGLVHRRVGVAALSATLAGCATQPSGDCLSFERTTIAALRTHAVAGCVEVTDVVVEGRTPSTTAPRVFATDRGGGPYAAIMAKCSAEEEPRCAPEAERAVARTLRGAVVTLRGYYWRGASSGFEELVLQDFVDSGTLAELPTPVAMTLEDASRGARSPEAWFHRVHVAVDAADPLVVVERSPAELSNGAPCPNASGFALARRSASSEAPGCDAPASPSRAPEPGALLVGRAFYRDFTWSSDCACAAAQHQKLLPKGATFTGGLDGVLTFVKPNASPTGSQVLEPQSNADVTIVSP